MNRPNRTILPVITVLLVLAVSAMWTVPALADDAPPPPAASPPGEETGTATDGAQVDEGLMEQLPEETEVVVKFSKR